jgi:GntR family transcriptional repressor for pyruvate dehydrogenase complex
MMEKSTLNRQRLYQQVADSLESQILDGTFPVGSRLPSEQDLADRYGVSRNVVREALKRLTEHGLVSILTGSGTYIKEPSTKPVVEAINRLIRHLPQDISIAHFYQIRRMLEPESARIAAIHATEEEIIHMTHACERMEKQRESRSGWSAADLEFHRLIALATHNPLVSSILEPLTGTLSQVIEAGCDEPSGIEAGLTAHYHILDAIKQHQPEAAYAAMLEHLIDSEARIGKLLGQD